MRSSSSSREDGASTRDAALVAHVKSTLLAAETLYGPSLITEPGLHFHPRYLYAETHFALAALLTSLLDDDKERWLDLAAARLRLWDGHGAPSTFFNAMAACLIALVYRRAGSDHPDLEAAISTILARTDEYRQSAYREWCGNNCYLQQVVVDLVLLPAARGEELGPDVARVVAAEFMRFRTKEGFFFDLPRETGQSARLIPPTYVMKILFLLGIAHEFYPADEFRQLFRAGVSATLPLLTREGNLSYFGRTDNSPFSAGLTLFNLRKALQLDVADVGLGVACSASERFYRSFPRSRDGLLECNRYFDAATGEERLYSKDNYAKVGEYSVASCAYALLGCFVAPNSDEVRDDAVAEQATVSAYSSDLGVANFRSGDQELIVRTSSDPESWDRRYLGPTLLSLRVGASQLVGAISKTVSSDRDLRPPQTGSRPARAIRRIKEFYIRGFEQLDASTVGFMPIVRHGSFDYLPLEIERISVGTTSVDVSYCMTKLYARGLGSIYVELRELARRRFLRHGEYLAPLTSRAPGISLHRSIGLEGSRCFIRDRFSGKIAGKTILFSTRSFAPAKVAVSGLEMRETFNGWGSNGIQTITVYGAVARENALEYECEIESKLTVAD